MRGIKAWLLPLLLIGCSGCGNQAYFIPSGVEIVIEKPANVVASVPDSKGVLQPHVNVTLQPGTLAKVPKVSAP